MENKNIKKKKKKNYLSLPHKEPPTSQEESFHQ